MKIDSGRCVVCIVALHCIVCIMHVLIQRINRNLYKDLNHNNHNV